MNVNAVGKHEGIPRSQVTLVHTYMEMSHLENYLHPLLLKQNVFPLTNMGISWNAREFGESG